MTWTNFFDLGPCAVTVTEEGTPTLLYSGTLAKSGSGMFTVDSSPYTIAVSAAGDVSITSDYGLGGYDWTVTVAPPTGTAGAVRFSRSAFDPGKIASAKGISPAETETAYTSLSPAAPEPLPLADPLTGAGGESVSLTVHPVF